MATLEQIWIQARSKAGSVFIDTDKYESSIYRGIKVVKDESGVRIYSTETEFYKDITDEFVMDSFVIGVNEYLKKKYLRTLDQIERAIKKNLNGSKNHKKFSYLKAMRENIITKYNEINT
jgi:hypothetical protein